VRVPAISFDPPVGAPGGVLPAAAAMAAGKTMVSPERRNGRSARRGAPADAPATKLPAPWTGEAAEPEPPAEPLPVYYPPLSEQRSVLHRPAPERPLPEPPRQRATARTPLDDTMRRVIGAV
jgi:hypothetical protein